MNSDFLREAISHPTWRVLRLQVKSAESPVLITGSAPDIFALVMPLNKPA